MCAGCGANVEPEWSPWLAHIMLLAILQDAGCAFRPNDLTLDQWAGLAEYKAARETVAREQAEKNQQAAGSGQQAASIAQRA